MGRFGVCLALLFALLGVVPGSAFASYAPSCKAGASGQYVGNSAIEAATAYANAYMATQPTSSGTTSYKYWVKPSSSDPNVAALWIQSSTPTQTYPAWVTQTFGATCSCPYGGAYDSASGICSGAPSCPTGMVFSTSSNTCAPRPQCTSGRSQDLYFFGPAGGGYLPESTCYNSCIYNQGSGVGFYDAGAYRPSDGATGAWHADYVGTGASCTQSGPATGAGDLSHGKPAPSCPSGQAVGTVNGVTGCYPSGKPNTTTTSAPSTDASGNTTTTTNITNVTGATTTNTTVTNATGGTTTTTTTTPGSGGTAGQKGVGSGAGGTVTAQDKTCADNPSLPGCAGSGGVFGGPPPPTYTPKSATFGNAISTFKDQVTGSGLGLAAVNFFNVQASGSCPTWTAQIPFLNYTLVFDYFCQDWATALYPLIGAAMLVVFGWIAFTIAVL